MTVNQANIVLAYARNSMSAKDTGRELHAVDQDIHYHLRKIKEDTGLNPKNFFDLCRLVGIAASVTGGRS